MSISREIGWGPHENLLYVIYKQLERMKGLAKNLSPSPSTTTTTTTISALYLGEYYFSDELVTDNYLMDLSGNNRNFMFTRRNCLIGDGTAKLTFSNLPTYDSLTIVADGITTGKYLTSSELILGVEKYNYAIFKNGGTEVAKFPLMEYDSDYPLPGTFDFYDVIGDASCTLTDGSSSNITKSNGLSWNFKYGFAVITGDNTHYPKKIGSGYGGITNQNIIIKSPYSTDSNQYIKAPPGDAVLIAKDTDEQFYDAGIPVNVHIADIYDSEYVQIIVNDNIVTSLTIDI